MSFQKQCGISYDKRYSLSCFEGWDYVSILECDHRHFRAYFVITVCEPQGSFFWRYDASFRLVSVVILYVKCRLDPTVEAHPNSIWIAIVWLSWSLTLSPCREILGTVKFVLTLLRGTLLEGTLLRQRRILQRRNRRNHWRRSSWRLKRNWALSRPTRKIFRILTTPDPSTTPL